MNNQTVPDKDPPDFRIRTLSASHPPSFNRESCMDMPPSEITGARTLIQFLIGVILAVALFLVSQHYFLLAHTLAELFSIAVAWGVFILMWNSRRIVNNDSLVMLGISYFFVGLIDLIHTMAYKGMGVLPGPPTADIATQLWISARYLESLSLLLFVMRIGKQARPGAVFWAYTGATALLLGAVFAWPVFPACYVEGVGLTVFKKTSEYVICLVLVASGLILRHKQRFFDADINRLMSAGILVTIIAELFFTQYVSVFGFANIVGHSLKVLSFYLIYLALIRAGLTRPYSLLFRDMRQTEESYRLQALRFSKILETTVDGFWLVDMRGHIVETNEAAARIAGYTQAELMSMHVSDINAIEEKEDTLRRINELVQRGHGRFESLHRRKDGSLIDVDVSVSYLDQDGGLFAVFIRDITEKKRSETALRRSMDDLANERAVLKAIFESTPDMIVLKNPKGVYRKVNPAFCRFMGKTESEIVGRTDLDLFPAADAESYILQDRGIMATGLSESGDWHVSGGNEAMWLHVVKTPVINAQGQTDGLLCSVHDISDRKQMEALLQARLRLSESATLPEKELLTLTLDEAEKLTGSRIAFFHYVETDESVISLQTWSTRTLQEFCTAIGFEHHYPVEKAGVWAECLRKRRTVIHNDYAGLSDRKGLPPGHASLVRDLLVPVFQGEKIVAILGVGNKPAEYTQRDIRIVSAMADLAWDIVVRNKAMAALRDSEDKYRSFIAYSTEGIYRLEMDTPLDTRLAVEEQVDTIYDNAWVAECNDTFAGMYGLSNAADLLGRRLIDLHGGKNHPVNRAEVRRFVESGYSVSLENTLETGMDGIARWFSNTTIGFVKDKKLLRMWGTQRDVTSSRMQEEELRRLALAIEQAAEAIMITDTEGTIQFINPVFEAVSGYALQEAVGKNPRILKSGKQSDAFYRNLWKTLLSGGAWKGRMINRRKNGSLFTIEGTISPVIDAVENIIGFVTVMRDITEDLKLEDKIRQSQKMEAIGTLAGGIAHDFNNILFPLVGFTEIIRDELSVDDPMQECVEGILNAAVRASDLVKQILTFSRQSEHDKTAIRVQSIVKEALKLVRASLPSNILIEASISDSCTPVLADATQLHQVTLNLITNAYHAMEATGGRLGIELKQVRMDAAQAHDFNILPGTYVCLSISDTGHGIDSAILGRIFEPYFTTKPEGKGTGLGLSITHGIVRNCGGDILVESRPGKGTKFDVYLPCLTEAETRDVQKTEVAIRGGDEHILLVDDEQPIIDMLTLMLKKLGYRLTVCTASTQALEMFQAGPDRFDLVITDLTMPMLTGDRLAAELKKLNPDIPVILCTGFSERITPEIAASMGIDGFVRKPILKRDIAVLIRKILDGRGESESCHPRGSTENDENWRK